MFFGHTPQNIDPKVQSRHEWHQLRNKSCDSNLNQIIITIFRNNRW